MLYRTDGPNEIVRIEGDYRPHQIDSATSSLPTRPTRALGR
jgi:hypothetical protein